MDQAQDKNDTIPSSYDAFWTELLSKTFVSTNNDHPVEGEY